MAGSFIELYSQEFTSTSTITVAHNLDRVICAVRVSVDATIRNDLVQSVTPSASDPRNELVVVLKGAETGVIQIVDSDYIWGSLPTPEGAAALGNNLSGSTFSGSFSGSFVGDGTALSITETDTLDDVTTRGSTTANSITIGSFISNGASVVTGNLDVTGKLTANEFHTQIVSSSVIYDSGSTKFGDSVDDLHQFTGSIDLVSGNIEAPSFTGSFSGDGSSITNAQVSGSNLLWVDISGSDTAGTRERFDKPYASIGGALSAASAGDVVVVRPGTYEEAITMVAGVSVVGMDRDKCILKKYSGGYAVTMADNCAFENMSIDINTSNGVSFGTTTAGTSAIRHVRVTSTGGNASGITITGGPVPAQNWITCDHVDVVGTGLSNAFFNNSAGTVNLRDCFGFALVGLQLASTSTTRVQDCRFSGFTGIIIGTATATLYTDQSTRWSSLTNAAGGTFAPDLTHLLVAAGSNNEIQISSGSLLSSSANLTFDGNLLEITGTLSIDGNANANRFDGLFVGDLTGDVTGNVLGNVTGDLVGTSSFADEAAKVSNALAQGPGIAAFSYDGSSTALVGIDNTVVTLTGVQTLSNKIVSGTFSGSFFGDGTALTITETDTLDDVTGRGNTTTNSITVNGITSNSNIILTGALAATGDIDNVGTYNGIQHYTSSAIDPTTPTPSNGDIYYNTALDMGMRYDSTRAKWLSVETSVIEFGRDGNTGGGSYYRGPGNRAYSASKGRTAEFNGTVISISYTRNDSDSATFEVTADGTGIATLASSAGTGKDATLDGDFTVNQILGVKNQTGSNAARHVLGWVRIRWRA